MRPIRLISPFPPGGFNDSLSRTVAQKLTDAWGQQVVVDNRPGANMIVASAIVAKAPADGYTMMMGAVPHSINPSLYKLPYDSVKDFTPLINIASIPNIVTLHPGIPAASIKELLVYARANPKKLTFGSTGNGSSSHLAGELMKITANVDMVHVPYKGATLALTDLIAGRLSLYIGAVATVLPHIRSGRLRSLGIATLKRVPSLPDVPTVHESGLPGYQVASWYGLLGPGGMPAPVVNKLNAEVKKIAAMPDVRERLARDGAEVVASTPAEFLATIREDTQTWLRVVKATGATAD